MIKKLLLFLLCLWIGASIGTYTAFRTIINGLDAYTYTQGPWKTWHSIGKPTIDPYSQAKITIYRWFPISAFETLYFMSNKDSAGDELNPKCTYLVSGNELKTTRWSLSVFQEDNQDKIKDTHKFSVNSENILRNQSGSWEIQISPSVRTGNAIETEDKQNYTLILRLYSYEQEKLDENFGPLPDIRKVSCS